MVISYNDPNPAAYARKLLKEFPQWPAAKNKRYSVLSDSIYLGPSNDLAVDRIARMLHPDAFSPWAMCGGSFSTACGRRRDR